MRKLRYTVVKGSAEAMQLLFTSLVGRLNHSRTGVPTEEQSKGGCKERVEYRRRRQRSPTVAWPGPVVPR